MKLVDDKKRYVLACSFGPDSMALLDMAIKEKIDIIVAHVNYHKRDVSNFEEDSLRKYCLDHNITIEVLDTAGMEYVGNFQNWARKIRYEFFKQVAEKHNCLGVLVAHQQDDLIETYLMQKNRKNIVKHPGIAEITEINGAKIIRPLLGFSKADLLEYDKRNNVPFSVDVSNLSDDYSRNKIRHSIVEKMTEEERSQILNELSEKLNESILFSLRWNLNDFLSLSVKDITLILAKFIEEKRVHRDISRSFVENILKALSSRKSNLVIPLYDGLVISKSYGNVYLLDSKQKTTYMYILNKGDVVDDNLFYLDFSDSFGDRNVFEKDFPITIKPIFKDDVYKVAGYDCSVRRLFIDWKVPPHLRECWPGIYNKDGKLIYIPRYREKFVDNHPAKFVIKFDGYSQII